MPSPTERLSTAVSHRYRIEGHLGEGGMATVYLAHDLKHDRKVALKVLRPELAAVIGAERFLAEIRTTANLQHPNILPLFDSGDADGRLFYVMPHVEGETLRDRIEHEKQLPVDDVVRLGAEVASALDYAHRQGVIHRDVKPENILIHDGRALVADFGIALAVSTAGSRMTETGMSVGTPHYMSPEQAMGDHEVTARSDVYALGATLYEALVGEPPFTGATAQAIIARIVTEDPRPLTVQRKTIPPHVEGAVLTALERLPADRFATAAEFGEALEGRGRVPTRVARRTVSGSAVPDRGVRVPRWTLPALGTVLVVLAATGVWGWLRPGPDLPVECEVIAVGTEAGPVGFYSAIAPDGSAMVYARLEGGRGKGMSLWLKEQSELEPRKLADIPPSGAILSPSFSPDGQWIAYTDGKLEKVARTGGVPRTLSDSVADRGAAWLRDGTIVFSGGGRAIFRVAADGGPTSVVLDADAAGGDLARVTAVPDADAVLVVVSPRRDPHVVGLDLKTGAIHVVVKDAMGGWVLPGGVLVYVQGDGTVLAAPFDSDALEVRGPPVTVAESIRVFPQFGPDIEVGRDGTLVYGTGTTLSRLELASVGLDGSAVALDSMWTVRSGTLPALAVSPDGGRVAVDVTDSTGRRTDVHVVDLPVGPERRLTFAGILNTHPAWSPDGKAVLYSSDAGGQLELWSAPADGSGQPTRVASERRPIQEGTSSPDGAWIIYRTDDTSPGKGDILAVRARGDTTPVPVAATPAREYSFDPSPDGRWLALTSDISGRPEVYVVPFPGGWPSGHWQVSTDGGWEARWSRDGRRLFYRSIDARMMVASVAGTDSFHVGERRALFDASGYAANPPVHSYALSSGRPRIRDATAHPGVGRGRRRPCGPSAELAPGDQGEAEREVGR